MRIHLRSLAAIATILLLPLAQVAIASPVVVDSWTWTDPSDGYTHYYETYFSDTWMNCPSSLRSLLW